ncbi:ribosomal protein S17 [Sphaerosporella brunnea]|uniref:Ribosomal protein S17 n=1 Tax=Sphaerosporella brunnea TaxID=1250544 RepID=A0A5J5F905_9PEZI|nr:ribosomal protein S17 [Sphaerosporella brunnea]
MSAAAAAAAIPRTVVGTVVSAGLSKNTVKVRLAKQVWNAHLRKNFRHNTHVLADDYANACVAGDVVALRGGIKTSARKRHVVEAFVSPMRTGEVRRQPEGVAAWIRRKEEKLRAELVGRGVLKA